MNKFDLQRALDNDGKCLVKVSSALTVDAKIIHIDQTSTYPIVAVVDYFIPNGDGENIRLFDHDFRMKDNKAAYLINIPDTIEAWIIAYRHKLNGEIKLSANLSAWEKDGTIQAIYKIGHQILDMKCIQLEEGGFDYKTNIIESEIREDDIKQLLTHSEKVALGIIKTEVTDENA